MELEQDTVISTFELTPKKGVDLNELLNSRELRDDLYLLFRHNVSRRSEELLKKQINKMTFKHFTKNEAAQMTKQDFYRLFDECAYISKFTKIDEIATHGYFHVEIIENNMLAVFKTVMKNLGVAEDNVAHVIHIITHKTSPEPSLLLIDNASTDVLNEHKEAIARHPRPEVTLRLLQRGVTPDHAYHSQNMSIIKSMIEAGNINPLWYTHSDVQVKLALIVHGEPKFLKNDASQVVRRAYVEKTQDITNLVNENHHSLINLYLSYLDKSNKDHRLIASSFLKKHIDCEALLSQYVMAIFLSKGMLVEQIAKFGAGIVGEIAKTLLEDNEKVRARTLRAIERFMNNAKYELDTLFQPEETLLFEEVFGTWG